MEKMIEKNKPIISILLIIILGVITVISIIYGVFSFLRDEGFLPESANEWQLRGLLGGLAWYWFLIFGLLVVCISAISGAIKLAIKNQDVKIIVGIKNFVLKNNIYHFVVPRVKEKAIEAFISKEKIRQLNRYPKNKGSDNLERATKKYLSQKVGELAEKVGNEFRHTLRRVGFEKAVERYIKDLHELLLTRTKCMNLIEVLPTFINMGIKESRTNIIRFVLSKNLRFPTEDERKTLWLSHKLELPKEPDTNKNYFRDLVSISNKIDIPYVSKFSLKSNKVNVIRNIEGPRYDCTVSDLMRPFV